MKLLIAIFSLFQTLSTFHAFAQWGSPCLLGTERDQFAAGQAEALSGHSLSPWSQPRNSCYQMGHTNGSQTRERHLFGGALSMDCEGEFQNGRNDGKLANSAQQSECYSIGNLLGKSELSMAARTGDSVHSSSNCVALYRYAQNNANQFELSPEQHTAMDAHCYQLGLYERR